MMRRRILRKNKKRIDPRYFLHEQIDPTDDINTPEMGDTSPVEPPAPAEPAAKEETSQPEWVDRQEWVSAKGPGADETTDETHEALSGILGSEYNVIDPFDVEQLRKVTMDAHEKDIIPLGIAEGYIWFKTGDHKYGKLKLQAAPGDVAL